MPGFTLWDEFPALIAFRVWVVLKEALGFSSLAVLCSGFRFEVVFWISGAGS